MDVTGLAALNRCQRAGTGAAIIAGNGDQVRIGLGHARGYGADTSFSDQLDRYQRLWIDLFQIKDQLCEVFN